MQTSQSIISLTCRILFWVILVGSLGLVSQSKYRLNPSDCGRTIACALVFFGSLLNYREGKLKKWGNMVFTLGLAILLLINLLTSYGSGLASLLPLQDFEKNYAYTDFRHFYFGAEAVYVRGIDPYSWQERGEGWVLPGSGYPNAFPFPTYYIFHLLSLGNRFSLVQTGLAVSYLMVLLILLGFYLTGLLIKRMANGRQIGAFFFVLCVGSGFASGYAFNLLQTSIICFFGTSLTLYLWITGRGKVSIVMGGFSLSLCVLLKPPLALFYLFFLASFVLGVVEKFLCGHRKVDSRAGLLGIWASVFLLLLPAATLILPGGLNLSHYQMFPAILAKTMILNTADSAARLNFSPIYIFQTRLEKILGYDSPLWPVQWTSVLAASLLILILLWCLVRFGRGKRIETASLWLIATLLTLPFTWAFYAVWIIPAGVYIIKSALTSRRIEEVLAGCCILALLQVTSSFLFSIGFVLLFMKALLNVSDKEMEG